MNWRKEFWNVRNEQQLCFCDIFLSINLDWCDGKSEQGFFSIHFHIEMCVVCIVKCFCKHIFQCLFWTFSFFTAFVKTSGKKQKTKNKTNLFALHPIQNKLTIGHIITYRCNGGNGWREVETDKQRKQNACFCQSNEMFEFYWLSWWWFNEMVCSNWSWCDVIAFNINMIWYDHNHQTGLRKLGKITVEWMEIYVCWCLEIKFCFSFCWNDQEREENDFTIHCSG